MLIQRSKIDLLRMSDDNNAYFHATLKAKYKSNNMRMLKVSDGSFVSDQAGIMKEVMTFYQKLMGTRDDNLKHVDI